MGKDVEFSVKIIEREKVLSQFSKTKDAFMKSILHRSSWLNSKASGKLKDIFPRPSQQKLHKEKFKEIYVLRSWE